jgi:Fe-S-cluster containining protein
VPVAKDSETGAAPSGALCLACGLCCNGVLFRDVELQPADDAAVLAALGLPIGGRSPRRPARLPQPCAALCADNRCRVYEIRPRRCRQFECVLLQQTGRGEVALAAALGVVRLARHRAARVRELLRMLGDTEEDQPLSRRFQRIRRRLERAGFDDATADIFAQLTLAVHELNLLLRERFYPG